MSAGRWFYRDGWRWCGRRVRAVVRFVGASGRWSVLVQRKRGCGWLTVSWRPGAHATLIGAKGFARRLALLWEPSGCCTAASW